jgi:hypothetical protein
MILGVIRILIFFGMKPSKEPEYFFQMVVLNASDTIQSPLLSSRQSQVAFAIDWIASIIPTFMGIYVALFLLVGMCSILIACGCVHDTLKGEEADWKGCSDCCSLLCLMCASKPNHRCVTLTWNCPCYRARPSLRFQVRFGMVGSFIILRILAIILYASDKTASIYALHMAFVCSISVMLLFFVAALDFYQYRVWWYYRPDGAYQKCRCCCCRQHFHPSHKYFFPMPLLGFYRDQNTLGDRPCRNTISGNCSNRSLEHIVRFHAFDFKPQRRFDPSVDKTFIGFHQTTPEAAASIAKTGFRISNKPPQMLGFGVYFARSFADTTGKARATGELIDDQLFSICMTMGAIIFLGAFICAEVNLGRVRMINVSEIDEVRNTDSWWNEYDTIYYAHENENRDEFCMKDPNQILEWIIVMNDDRMKRYGLDREFDNTRCFCI